MVGVGGEREIVLKNSPKRRQTIWFTEDEEIRLKSFVSHDVKSEVALNSTCTEIVNMVLENDDLRRKAVARIDEKYQKRAYALRSTTETRDAAFLRGIVRCPVCNVPSSEFHIKSNHPKEYKSWVEARKAPLVVEVRRR